MKIGKKQNKPSDNSDESEGSESLEGLTASADFAITDAAGYAGAVKTSKAMSLRAPEVWVKDGERVRLRFRTAEPVVSFEAYRFKSRGKWIKAIRPASGKVDRFAERGMNAQRLFVYEVNELDGYRDKKTGKAQKFLPRFYVVGVRHFEQLKMLEDSQGLPLTKYDITIARQGQLTNTTYMFIPSAPSPMPEEVKRAERLDWKKYYKPLPVAVQESLLGGVTGDDRD